MMGYAIATSRMLGQSSSLSRALLCCWLLANFSGHSKGDIGVQVMTFFVGDMPVQATLTWDSDLDEISKEQCEELRKMKDLDLWNCINAFKAAIKPHQEELKLDVNLGRERISHDNERHSDFLKTLDLRAARAESQKACRNVSLGPGVPFAFNPEDIEACAAAHGSFSWIREQALLPHKGYVTDFLGIRTKYQWDCATPSVVPSRRQDCERYDDLMGESAWQTPIEFLLPAVDEEYFEWIDVLSSAADNSKNEEFVVIEVGAGYAPWSVRAFAANQLMRKRPIRITIVEAHPKVLDDAKAHLALNGIAHRNVTVVHAAVGQETGTTTFLTGACSLSSGFRAPDLLNQESQPHTSEISEGSVLVNVTTIAALLYDHHHVDYLDVDIQGAESYALTTTEARLQMKLKVKRIHIGTHHLTIHQQLRQMLQVDGWVLQEDYPPSSSIKTRFGFVSFRDGVLSARMEGA